MKTRRPASLHVSTALSFRGGENQVLLLLEGLRDRGHDVFLVAPAGSALLRRVEELGLPCEALPVRREWNPLGFLQLARLLRRRRPDVLHLHDGHAVLPGKIAAQIYDKTARKEGRRLLVVSHRRTLFPLRSTKKYLGRVDKVIAISRAVQKALTDVGIPAKRTAVVPSGLKFPPLVPKVSSPNESSGKERPMKSAGNLRTELGIPTTAFVVAHAAAFTAEKRQEDLIAAAALVKEKEGKNPARPVYWIMAGEGPRQEELRRLASATGVEERVRFSGWRRDLSPLWETAQAAVFTSELEGLCTALVEAQGAGLPAVSTRCGGPEEVVEDGVTGFLVEVGDMAAVAERCLRWKGDEALRRRMGTAATDRMRRLFSAEAMVDGILRVYEG